jgi:hypothetical protein
MFNKGVFIMIKGRCECNRVTYEVRGELKDFCHCHCSICQRIHGAAFVTWGGIARDEFAFKSGESNLKRYAYSERADSVFCGECGSTVLVDFKSEVDRLYIALGTVVGDMKCPPGFHQFVDSKVPWYEICDDLPQYDEWPDETQ